MVVVLSTIGLLMGLYVAWRLFWPLRLPAWAKVLLSLLLVAVAVQLRIVASFWGTMASPEIPKMAIAVLATGSTAVLMLALAMLLFDAGLLAARMLRLPRAVSALRAPRLRPLAAGVALLLSGYGVSQGMAVPKPRQIDVAVKGLPAAFDGYRVLQLTDIHASRLLTGDWVRKVVAESNALKPDLIVITGDLIDGTVEARRNDYRPLGDLQAPDGVIAITGNHEYYAQYSDWMQAFRALRMQVLENSHTQVRRGDAALTIAGVTDPVAARYGLPLPDLDAALAGADPAAPVILLDHRPRNAAEAAARGVKLQLSGHTHGGQIIGMDQLVKRANGGFVSGRYEVDGMTLYVSNGAGLWAGFPARIGVPSEITVFTLRRAP
ncbi:TPA: metallophosphoesterase [Stenotrophomonas maltophilia]|uniref:metallophosphoesterase n=1 Tax=Stenotrophomonas sp. TaxID=69392 RepID=UPI0028AC60F5|nr:metallophosphoesterase [Stenotrophomonas sp.]HDS0948600.1 metallophosphoesterase [Stenotrophomonas maltophilia]HDS1027749.1 metallophosphoesterase [Stenotrophomonas maltophilia]HDS1028546.1 metallophosphoesterase [Stenotrophomonas maltophilia]HDS1034274.1 metallophosphoesterase [Stenotrophomonas maltophilia]